MYVEQGSSSFFILGRFYKYYVIIIQCRTIVTWSNYRESKLRFSKDRVIGQNNLLNLFDWIVWIKSYD